MPPHTKLKGPPFTYLAPGGVWPDGPLVDDAPAEALLAQAIAKRLHEARGDRSGRDIAREAKISPTTVSKYLKGKTWGDLPTLCRIELAVGTQLWGDEHLAVSRPHDYLADDAVWPTRLSRPRDYLESGAAWPIGPLRDSAPPEAHLVLAIAQRVHRARGRPTISRMWTSDHMTFQVVNAFLDGQSWGNLRVIAHLDATLASGLWGYQHLDISLPRNYVTAGNWPEGSLRDSAPLGVYHLKDLAKTLRHLSTEQKQILAESAQVSVQAIQDIVEGVTWSDMYTFENLLNILTQVELSPTLLPRTTES